MCILCGCNCPISYIFFVGMILLSPMATLAQQHIQVEFKARHWATAMDEPKMAEPVNPVKESQQHPATKSYWSRACGDGCKLGQAKEEPEEFRSIKLLLAAAKDEAGIQNYLLKHRINSCPGRSSHWGTWANGFSTCMAQVMSANTSSKTLLGYHAQYFILSS